MSRDEFIEVVHSLRQIERNTDDIIEHANRLTTQITRMGQMQAEIDSLKRAFAKAGKPIAAICHGPWLLVEADLLRGRKATAWPSIRTDLRNAGAIVVDQPAVTDGNIVTSRKPEDVTAFTEALIAILEA